MKLGPENRPVGELRSGSVGGLPQASRSHIPSDRSVPPDVPLSRPQEKRRAPVIGVATTPSVDQNPVGLPQVRAAREPSQSVGEPIPVSEEGAEIKPFYRGTWVEGTLQNGDKIPVGGGVFEDALHRTLEVDTDSLPDAFEGFTKERLDAAYQNNGAQFAKLVADNNVAIDPQTLHTLVQVQMRMERILAVDDSPLSPQRDTLGKTEPNLKVSGLVGISACGERSIVGKQLLDQLGESSALMAGVVADEVEEGVPADVQMHVNLVLPDGEGPGSLVYDIARPVVHLNRFPAIYRTDVPLDYDGLVGKKSHLIPAKSIYTGETVYFGVGHPDAVLLEEV